MTKQLPIARSRLFRRTLLSYLLILFIPLFIFTNALISRNKQAAEERQIQEISQKMELLTRNLDDKFYQLNMLGQSLIGSNWLNRAFSRSQISFNLTVSEKTNTIQQLNTYAAMTPFARDFAVVLPLKGEVINGNAWREMGEYYRSIDIMDQEEQNRLTGALRQASGFWLMRELPGGPATIQSLDIISAPRAVLYAPLDLDEICRYVEGFRYGDLAALTIAEEGGGLEILAAPADRERLYERTIPSSLYAWSYRVAFRRQDDHSAAGLISSVVSVVALATALALAASFVAARASYKPIGKLMAKVGQGQDRKKHEYEVIEDSFDKLSQEKEEATHRMQAYRDIGRNSLILSLLRGFFSERQDSGQLASFQLDFTDKDWYSVFLCRMSGGEQNEETGMPLYLAVQSHCQEASRFMTPVEIAAREIAVILRSPEILDNDLVEAVTKELLLSVRRQTGAAPDIVKGTCEKGLIGISKSYQNIKDDDLRRLMASHHGGPGPREEKRYYYPTDWEIQLIHHLKTGNQVLSQRILSELRAENKARDLPPDMTNRVTTLLFETILRVMEELKLDMSAARILYDGHGGKSAEDNRWDALRAVVDNICNRDPDSFPEDISVGDQMIQYVQEHYGESSLSLNELGDKFGLSVSTVSRMFKASAKLNFIDYVTSIRMEKAKEYLGDGGVTVQEAARLVGYENDVSFKRAFLRYQGMTPKQYSQS